MKIRIDGRELLVKQTTRGIVEFQRQSGIVMHELSKAELAPYAPALAAFHALHNAGFNPSWDELLDRDVTDFEMIQEPGDDRTVVVDAVEPPSSPADSDPESGEEQPTKVAPGSKHSNKPKGGSKTR